MLYKLSVLVHENSLFPSVVASVIFKIVPWDLHLRGSYFNKIIMKNDNSVH